MFRFKLTLLAARNTVTLEVPVFWVVAVLTFKVTLVNNRSRARNGAHAFSGRTVMAFLSLTVFACAQP
jgi:hypothetical protein